MAFELVGPTRQTSIEHHDELLFDIATRTGVHGPEMKRLWEEFYDGPTFTPEEAKRLAREFMALLDAMRSAPELEQKTWEAQPEVYRRNYGRPAPGRLQAKCADLIAVCEDGARGPEGLRGLSD